MGSIQRMKLWNYIATGAMALAAFLIAEFPIGEDAMFKGAFVFFIFILATISIYTLHKIDKKYIEKEKNDEIRRQGIARKAILKIAVRSINKFKSDNFDLIQRLSEEGGPQLDALETFNVKLSEINWEIETKIMELYDYEMLNKEEKESHKIIADYEAYTLADLDHQKDFMEAEIQRLGS